VPPAPRAETSTDHEAGPRRSPDRVAFFEIWPFHRPILEPIHVSLDGQFRTLVTDDPDEVIRFAPRIVVAADKVPDKVADAIPSAIRIWTRHGFSHKRNVEQCIKASDIACISSDWVRDDFERRRWSPRVAWWITGFPAMDAALDCAARRGETPYGSDEPTLLYAPTYTPSLSAADVLGTSWLDALASRFPTLRVVIKPHPMIPDLSPEWIRMWREAERRHAGVELKDADENVYDLMLDADILLTDASSVMFYWLAFDRPLVLVNNPERFLDTVRFDPDAPEWTWRDAGIEIDSADALPDAVARSLERPTEHAAMRALYRRRVFGDAAGSRAGDRIARGISMLLQPTRDQRGDVNRMWSLARQRARRIRWAAREKRLRRAVWRVRKASRRLRGAHRSERRRR
jgi:teichoic acid glycerol-phosphate transferase